MSADLVINCDHLANWNLWEFPRYDLVIPTIPPEPLFWQDLARCDYFQTSVKIDKADIYKVVGVISGLMIRIDD